MMYGISFNNKHSFKDFNMRVISRDVKTPAKIKITERVAFSNIEYDFSNIYGSQTYESRELIFVFQINELMKNKLEVLRMSIENWLNSPNKKIKLIDDLTPDYYFLAECVSTDFENLRFKGEITATFNAYPFRIKDIYEGNLAWNSFCFELDIFQDTCFTIKESEQVKIYNLSAINVVPTIICDKDMKIIKNNITYNIKDGETKDYRFELDIGENRMTIEGNGTIEFKFRKELL